MLLYKLMINLGWNAGNNFGTLKVSKNTQISPLLVETKAQMKDSACKRGPKMPRFGPKMLFSVMVVVYLWC